MFRDPVVQTAVTNVELRIMLHYIPECSIGTQKLLKLFIVRIPYSGS